MSSLNFVVLKPRKEIPVLRKHPWIFSGAVASLPAFEDGDLLPVSSSQGERLGWGMFNRRSNIIGRMVSFNPDVDPHVLLSLALERAAFFRKQHARSDTTAYRLVNGEGDNLPGLIVDKYGDYLVFQIHTLGIEKARQEILEFLIRTYNPLGIFEKSTGTSRRHEGLQDRAGIVYGTVPGEILISENGLTFHVDILEGQKTGFFIDQRPMRQRIGELSQGKRILNCFCYTGGFSVYALAGGALNVDSVDISEKAIALTEKNLMLNSTNSEKRWDNSSKDVFAFIKESDLDYDLVILDPPAFAKKQTDLKQACKGYRNLNKAVFQKAQPGMLVLTCSCSQPISEEQFLQAIFEAALEARCSIQVLEKQRHAWDHPVSLFHPEGSYLKGFLLRITETGK